MLDCPKLSTSLFHTLHPKSAADIPVRGPKEPRKGCTVASQMILSFQLTKAKLLLVGCMLVGLEGPYVYGQMLLPLVCEFWYPRAELGYQYSKFLMSLSFGTATAKNSEMISRGRPLVSGTFRKTKIQATTLTIAKMPNAPWRPSAWFTRGNEYVTMTLVPHIAAAQIPMQSPRTLVGKISEHKMFGIGPNPEKNRKLVRHLVWTLVRHSTSHNYQTWRTVKLPQNKNVIWNETLPVTKEHM